MMSDVERMIREIGEAGVRLSELRALEGAAGNISVFIAGNDTREIGNLTRSFDEVSVWAPPEGIALLQGVLLITGAGRRLRDGARDPLSVLCAIVAPEGEPPTLRRAGGSDVRPTSEIATHIGIHSALASRSIGGIHTVIHAQPPYLTWLSHIPAYREFGRLNRQLLRWQPETIVMLPEGFGILPFQTPSTPEQGRMTVEAAMRHRLIVWSKHGVVAHAAGGPPAATDLIDYAEAAARYEALDLQAGRPADGMTLAEIRMVARQFGVDAGWIDRLPAELLGKA
jgi:rhamnulose-1-phosphate aldolase